jgi:hypothetical protein
MPFADLLQWLGDARRSGTLSVNLDFEERFMRFEHGKIAAYGSDDPMARDIGRLCLSRGLCNEPWLFKALDQQRESQMPLADVLVACGAVKSEQLEEAVRTHVEETVLGLFLWPEGRFDFTEKPPRELADWMPPEYELSEPIDVRGVLMEGMRRLDEWQRIVKVLPSDDALVMALAPAADLPILESIAAHPEPPSLGELLAECGDTRFHVCEQLFRAFERGLVAFESHRPRLHHKTARGATTVEHLVRAADSLISENQLDEAATLLRSAVAMDPFRADARALMQKCKNAQLIQLYARLPPSQIPEIVMRPERIAALDLPPRERRLIGAITGGGRWDVATIAIVSGMGELETLRALGRLVHAGVVRLSPA